jgi:hypothetical protein
VLQAMVEAQPAAPRQPAAGTLGKVLAALRAVIQPGSLVLLLSDFSQLDDAAESTLTGLTPHNDCRLLWIADPLEMAGLPDGSYRVGLPGRLWWLDGAQSRSAWMQAWAELEQRLQALARRLDLPLTRLVTAEDVAEVLPPLLRDAA